MFRINHIISKVVGFLDKISEKSLLSLGEFYVYALIDPRSNAIFYIGKGTKK